MLFSRGHHNIIGETLTESPDSEINQAAVAQTTADLTMKFQDLHLTLLPLPLIDFFQQLLCLQCFNTVG